MILDALLSKITSEHNQQPDYIATLTVTVQPLLEAAAAIAELTLDFDLDLAIGVQLDAVGVRVGRDRFVTTPLNIYFSFGVAGLGFGQGIWKKPTDPTSGLSALPDEIYRVLLRARILANSWSGFIPDVYGPWNVLMAGTGCFVLVQDYGDETMAIVLAGVQPDPLSLTMYTDSGLDQVMRPATYTLYRLLPTVYPAAVVSGTPLFGFGVESDTIAGFGRGAWTRTI